MQLLGAVFALVTGILFSLRGSFTKDLKSYRISKLQINFYYRLFSLPVLFLVAPILGEKLFSFSLEFLFWLAVSTTINIVWSLYNVYIYQKSPFSSTESFYFINIVFSTVAGAILFNEFLSPARIIGISIAVFALLILLAGDIKDRKMAFINVQIVIYYLLTVFVNLGNKQAIAKSSPVIFSVSVTIALIVANFVLLSLRGQRIRSLNNFGMSRLLLLIGLLSGFAVLGLSYAYKLLPLGVVVTLLSSRVFFSMWISKVKYKEEGIVLKVAVSAVALIGIGIMFI